MQDASPAGRVLVLVQALIVYGQQLLDGLRQPHPDPKLGLGFGPITLASIVARVLRGLRIAAALEERLLRPARKQAAAVVHALPAQTPRAQKPRAAMREARRQCDDDRMPTEEEIAAMLRQRPVGAVLADICRDLGIGPQHPLWHDLHRAIVETGGNVVRLLMDMIRHYTFGFFRKRFATENQPVSLDRPLLGTAATGPPGLQPAL